MSAGTTGMTINDVKSQFPQLAQHERGDEIAQQIVNIIAGVESLEFTALAPFTSKERQVYTLLANNLQNMLLQLGGFVLQKTNVPAEMLDRLIIIALDSSKNGRVAGKHVVQVLKENGINPTVVNNGPKILDATGIPVQ